MGAERKIVQNAIFHGKRHDNKILKAKLLLSRNVVVMAQAPAYKGVLDFQGRRGIASVVRWTLRPVIFGVDWCTKSGTPTGGCCLKGLL